MRLNLSPASQVRSNVAPVRKLRSFMRTIAPPRPIFTCCQSRIPHGWPSNSKVMPFFRSPVDIIFLLLYILLSRNHEAGRRLREDFKSVFCHQATIFDTYSTPARDIDSRLNSNNGTSRQHHIFRSLL